MRSWSLDDHPVLINFRKVIDCVPHSDGRFYHLFLIPPYSLNNKNINQPLNYVFYSTQIDPNLLQLYGNPKVQMTRINDDLLLGSEFKKNKDKKIPVFFEQPCTSSDGFCFTMYEIFTDIYNPGDAPPFCKRILDIYQDAEQGYNFLEHEIKNYKKLQTILKQASDYIFITQVNEKNYQDFLQRLQVTIDKVCEAVFQLPMCKDLPVYVRTKLNYLIFNSLTAKVHFRLLVAYHTVYKQQNLIAQQNMRKYEIIKNDEITVAVQLLKNVLHMPTPGDCISCLVKFFDAVVNSLKSDEVAADDILPAICQAMTHDPSFGSHCVSFLTYLSEIWPGQGLDERTSYILITCSIAATHLGTQRNDSSEKKAEQNDNFEVGQKVTGDTIDMLNEMLDFL
ncbi:hypothetical protein TRFO_06218 [Tritrichomonas foetus]|uniref:VPS9 domain-containing protein n=1 Tax=Tritrichomonas foetus TaxID=1144522 RepID=A0A1J4K4X9_9EUKA|nr:hypothetical protein TRFO_06218 [Tritrichomonas foetus]|eukprot:OHT04772.1 hypothetical protein TRFO_06218 [Tritrichomonas foetus]